MFVSLHSLLKEKVSKELPHSSSGPGHLPLTQKIISSTLICGTNNLPNKGGFLFLAMSGKSRKFAS